MSSAKISQDNLRESAVKLKNALFHAEKGILRVIIELDEQSRTKSPDCAECAAL